MASGTDEFSAEGLIGGGFAIGGLIDICSVLLKLGSGVVDAGVVDAGVGEGFAVTTVGMKSSLELTIASQQFA